MSWPDHHIHYCAILVDAIMGIKLKYLVKRNWTGDPCFPDTLWNGVMCNNPSADLARIISLWVFVNIISNILHCDSSVILMFMIFTCVDWLENNILLQESLQQRLERWNISEFYIAHGTRNFVSARNSASLVTTLYCFNWYGFCWLRVILETLTTLVIKVTQW